MERIGVLTSGGDTPGMNAAIRAVVRAALSKGMDVMGIQKGFAGLIEGRVSELYSNDVDNIVSKGGTVLKTARCEAFKTKEGIEKGIRVLKAFDIEGLVVIGGDGSMKGALDLAKRGIMAVGLPGTIDNDLAYTDYTIGFDTAVNHILEHMDTIKDTMSSHERIGVIEVMGNKCGDIALYSGMLGGAERIIIPEIGYDIESVCDMLKNDRIKGKYTRIIVVAEGAAKSWKLVREIQERTGFDAKAIVLGYIQRGGSPTMRDRMLATCTGVRAVELLDQHIGSRAVGIKDDKIVDFDLEEALNMRLPFRRRLYDIAVMLANN